MDEVKGSKDGANSKVESDKIDKSRKRGRKPGTPKTGGRAKGTPNKATSKWSDVLQAEEFSIPEQAMKLFFEKATPPNLKLQILQFLAQYTVSAIKAKEEEQTPEPEQPSGQNADILSLVNEK